MTCVRSIAMYAALLLPCSAFAAHVQLHVVDQRGALTTDAVVTLQPSDAAVAAAKPTARTKLIDQKNEAFVPYVEVFRPGDSVQFSNSDQTQHHAYSFAAVKSFEFVLRPGERSTPMLLEHPGIAAVGCNIHDRMLMYLFVSPARWVLKTGVDGAVAIDDVPVGNYTLSVWHPQLRPGDVGYSRAISISGDADTLSIPLTLNLGADPRSLGDRERSSY